MNHAPAILVVPALIYSTPRLDYCCHFHLCSLVGRYTVLEVWAVQRPVRVSCGSRWGRCGLFINILDSLTAPCIRPRIQYTAVAASMAGAYVHTLAGAAGAWFIRTLRNKCSAATEWLERQHMLSRRCHSVMNTTGQRRNAARRPNYCPTVPVLSRRPVVF